MATVTSNPTDHLLNSSDLLAKQDPTVRLFWFFLLAHVLIWWAICLFTQPNMPLDMVEMLYWGQQWQWGYHKHPPLPAWTAATMWELGGHHPWALYLTSQLTIAVTFWAVWKLAREIVSPKLALCSVMVMEGCYYCNFMINDINNTIVTRPMWALTILLMYRALTRPKLAQQTTYWCLTGVAIGLGMLCKYYMGVLVLALMAIPILIPQTRRSLRTPGPYLMAGITLLMFLPHAIWMVDNDFITIRYVFNRSSDAAADATTVSLLKTWLSHLVAPVSFIMSQLGAVIPVFVLLLPLIGAWKLKRSLNTGDSSADSFSRQYLCIAIGGPILIYVLLAAVTGATIRSMWGGPLFSFLGLLIIALFQIDFSEQAYRKVLRNAMIAAFVMAAALFVRNGFGPALRGKLSKVHFPGQQVTQEVNALWARHYDRPLEIVGGQMFVCGCVGVYSDQPVDVFAGLKPEANPWVSDQRLTATGGMILWDLDKYGPNPPAGWMARFPTAQMLPTITCPTKALAGDINSEVGVIMVHPQNSKLARKQTAEKMR